MTNEDLLIKRRAHQLIADLCNELLEERQNIQKRIVQEKVESEDYYLVEKFQGEDKFGVKIWEPMARIVSRTLAEDYVSHYCIGDVIQVHRVERDVKAWDCFNGIIKGSTVFNPVVNEYYESLYR